MIDIKNSGSQLELEPEPEIRIEPPKPYWFGRILTVVAIIFTATVVVLEILGIIHELGEILTVVGTGVGVYSALTTATQEGMGRLQAGILRLQLQMTLEGVRSRNAHARHTQTMVDGLADIVGELKRK